MPDRQNTNLSDTKDASQNSTASNLTVVSMTCHPPRSPQPMTRAHLNDTLAGAPPGTTGDELREVDGQGNRRYEQLAVAGMLTANDPDASSQASTRQPSPDNNAADAQDRVLRPRGKKRLRDALDDIDPTAKPTTTHQDRHAKYQKQIKHVDGCFCFKKEGESSGTAADKDNAIIDSNFTESEDDGDDAPASAKDLPAADEASEASEEDAQKGT